MKRIVVIGGGPAGYPAALTAARLGAQVTLVEKNQLGGVCLHCGCIPSKSMLDIAHRFAGLAALAAVSKKGADELARRLLEKKDWAAMQARQQKATQKLSQGIGFLLKKANVNVIYGEASFVDDHTVRIRTAAGLEVWPADGIILATGSEAFLPPPFDSIRTEIYDNSTLFQMPSLPESMAIIGGGVIGCEMADFLSALGVAVHVIEMQPRILPAEDETAARTLERALTKRGVVFHTGVSAKTVFPDENGRWQLALSDGTELHMEKILAAIGRSVDLSNLHPEKIGLEWSSKGVKVNPRTLQLKNHIYAAGDVTGLCQLAHAASRQGEVAASNLCGQSAVYENETVPRAIYTSPEIASVGLTKMQAQSQGIAVRVHKSFFLANGRAVAQDQTEGYVELIANESNDKLLGGSIVGAHASELIHVVSVAIRAGFTCKQLQEVIFAHPTFAEAIAEAARL